MRRHQISSSLDNIKVRVSTERDKDSKMLTTEGANQVAGCFKIVLEKTAEIPDAYLRRSQPGSRASFRGGFGKARAGLIGILGNLADNKMSGNLG